MNKPFKQSKNIKGTYTLWPYTIVIAMIMLFRQHIKVNEAVNYIELDQEWKYNILLRTTGIVWEKGTF